MSDIPGIIPQGARVSYSEPGARLMYQPFEVYGVKYCRSTLERAEELRRIMSDRLAAYFAVMPPVRRWRPGREPKVDIWEDFEKNQHTIQASARGWFDVLVRLDNMRPRYDNLGG